MQAKVLKIDGKLFDNEVVKIVVPAVEGLMCVLPHHMPIITGMQKGQLRLYTSAARPTIIDVEGGIFSLADEIATVIL